MQIETPRGTSSMSRKLIAAPVVVAALVWGAAGALAESCEDKAAEGSGPSREAAMRQAFATVLQATDPQVLQLWLGARMRVGEAPGYAVRKLSVNCTQGGPGQICKIETTLCKP